jgi:hypothetical protein
LQEIKLVYFEQTRLDMASLESDRMV